jgi:hypothetical protein
MKKLYRNWVDVLVTSFQKNATHIARSQIVVDTDQEIPNLRFLLSSFLHPRHYMSFDQSIMRVKGIVMVPLPPPFNLQKTLPNLNCFLWEYEQIHLGQIILSSSPDFFWLSIHYHLKHRNRAAFLIQNFQAQWLASEVEHSSSNLSTSQKSTWGKAMAPPRAVSLWRAISVAHRLNPVLKQPLDKARPMVDRRKMN